MLKAMILIGLGFAMHDFLNTGIADRNYPRTMKEYFIVKAMNQLDKTGEIYESIAKDIKRKHVDYKSYCPGYGSHSYVNPVYSYVDPVFSRKQDAEDVRSQLWDLIEKYGVITISDLYECCEFRAVNKIPDVCFKDHNFGWKKPKYIGIYKNKDGYFALELPPVVIL